MGWGPGLSGAYWTLRITRRTEFLGEDKRRTQAAHRLPSFLTHSGSNPSFLLACWVRMMLWKLLSGCLPELQGESHTARPGCPQQVLGSLHNDGYPTPPKMFSDPSLSWRTPPSQPHCGKHPHPSPLLEDNSIPFWKTSHPRWVTNCGAPFLLPVPGGCRSHPGWMDPLCLPLVDLLLQVLGTESFNLVVHSTGLKTRKGGEGDRETPLDSPKR